MIGKIILILSWTIISSNGFVIIRSTSSMHSVYHATTTTTPQRRLAMSNEGQEATGSSSTGSPAFFASTITIEVHNDKQNQQPQSSQVAVKSDSATKSSSSSKELQMVDDNTNPYELIGIQEDQLALGISAKDFYKYIGTREQLIEKTLKDVESFDRAKAEAEVAKFMLDAEMINIYIQYQKEIERDPNFVVPDNEEKEGLFSFRTFVIIYLIYVAYDSIPKLVRNWIYDQQLDGTWSSTGIEFIDNWVVDTESQIAAARAAREASRAAADGIDTTAASLVSSTMTDTVFNVVPSSEFVDASATPVQNIISDIIIPSTAFVLTNIQSISDIPNAM